MSFACRLLNPAERFLAHTKIRPSLDCTPCLRHSEHDPTLSLTGWLFGLLGGRHHPLLFLNPRSRTNPACKFKFFPKNSFALTTTAFVSECPVTWEGRLA